MSAHVGGGPSVGVVVPTRSRPDMLRRALAAIASQDYGGPISCVVVFDSVDPDLGIGSLPGVRVLTNTRTPGLAGARNTGILSLDTDIVAFCDDDDLWHPGKLSAQVAALASRPEAVFASCGISVCYDDRRNDRTAGMSEIPHSALLRSRLAMLHSSTFVLDRRALVEDIGLIDEFIPGSQNEDYDLLLRASTLAPIVNVDRPLVDVLWGQTSYFSQQWETKASSLEWLLSRHPDLGFDRIGAARVYGQLAFARACQGRRRMAARWIVRSVRSNWREPRAPISAAVASGLVSGDRVLRALHRRGHGI